MMLERRTGALHLCSNNAEAAAHMVAISEVCKARCTHVIADAEVHRTLCVQRTHSGAHRQHLSAASLLDQRHIVLQLLLGSRVGQVDGLAAFSREIGSHD